MEKDNRDNMILELRKKLEIRTWVARLSIALNTAIIGGFLFHLFDHIGR